MTLTSSSGAHAKMVDLSTATCSDRQKFLFWQDVVSTYLSPSISMQAAPDKPFEGHLKCVRMGQVELAHHRCGPLLNVRNTQCIRRMPDDDYFVAVANRANAHLKQDHRTAVISDGDVVVYSSSTPFEWDCRGDSDFVLARIARRQIISRVPKIDSMTARVMTAGSPSGSIIGHAIREMVRMQDDINDSTQQRLDVSLIEIVTGLLNASFTLSDRSLLEADLLNKTKDMLRRNIENPDFDLKQLTQHLGVSARTIFRIFAFEGTTPMRWLWKQRLDLAFVLISEGRVKNVSQAAMQSGFNDFSHFSRSFRKEFNRTPSSVLRTELVDSG